MLLPGEGRRWISHIVTLSSTYTEKRHAWGRVNLPSLQLAISHSNSVERNGKKKNHQLMDYVCLATSYALEQGATPKGRWCGNSRNSHTHTHMSWAGLMLLVTHTLPCKWSSLLLSVICMGKKRSHATHSNDTAHTTCSSQTYMLITILKTINAVINSKWHLIYKALSGRTWHHQSPCISQLSPPSSPSWHRSVFICWAALRSWSNLDSAPFPEKSYQNMA